MQRIVSFLPSATELIYALKGEHMLKAVTHECTYPKDAKIKPKIISSVFDPEKMNSEEIDETTCKLLREGKEIFQLDEKVLKEANPDLIICQTTCEVCAAHTNLVDKAIQILPTKPRVFSMDPHNIDEIIQGIQKVSEIINKEDEGKVLKQSLKKRLDRLKVKTFSHKPKTLAIEWIKPFFTAGHWVPEMIKIAGGINLISSTGEHSRKMSVEEISKSDPERIIIMPCGFNAERALQEYNEILKNDPKWSELKAVKDNQIFFVDANSFFSKPSIRTITGIEILAKILHPEECREIELPEKSFLRL